MSGFLTNAFTVAAVLAGILFYLAGTLGTLRFPDPLSRIHAVTKVDNLGLGLVMLGLLPQMPGPLAALKLFAIWGILLIGSACAGQMAARMAKDEEDSAQ